MHVYANGPGGVQPQLLAGNGEGAIFEILGEEGACDGAA